MILKALRNGVSSIVRTAVLVTATVMASPAWAAVSVFEDEDEASGRNPYVIPYVVGFAFMGLVLWVICRSSRRNPV